jgi:hypothetical protein
MGLIEGVSTSQENNTGLGFYICMRVCMKRSNEIPGFRQLTTEWRRRNPNSANTLAFNHMHPGLHLSSWSCMRSLLHTLELHALPLPGLRIKTYLSHHLGIIINYYLQDLSPQA